MRPAWMLAALAMAMTAGCLNEFAQYETPLLIIGQAGGECDFGYTRVAFSEGILIVDHQHLWLI